MGIEHAGARLLLIDDDEDLGAMLSDYLESEGLHLTVTGSGETGIARLAGNGFQLLVLDIMLPGMSGLEVLRHVREKSDIPVIMLTARGEDVDRIIGLEIGADDYLAKPFNPRELLARINAILRRSQTSSSATQALKFSGIELDTRTRSVTCHENLLTLTGTEFEILRCLLETPGQVVNKERLSDVALGRRLLPYDRSIDTHISNLRGKLEKAGNRNVTIKNQRGIGYLLIPGE